MFITEFCFPTELSRQHDSWAGYGAAAMHLTTWSKPWKNPITDYLQDGADASVFHRQRLPARDAPQCALPTRRLRQENRHRRRRLVRRLQLGSCQLDGRLRRDAPGGLEGAHDWTQRLLSTAQCLINW